LGGKGIHGPIRGGEGIHECGQAAFEHGKKGIAHREPFGTAQDRMLQYMGDAGGIRRNGLKRHAKGVFPIRIADVDVPGAGAFMFQLVQPGLDIRQIGYLVNRVPAQPVSGGDTGIVCVFFIFMKISNAACLIGLPVREGLLHRFVPAAADAHDFFSFVQSEKNIAKLLVVVAGLLHGRPRCRCRFCCV
jgi:hypothetical protein